MKYNRDENKRRLIEDIARIATENQLFDLAKACEIRVLNEHFTSEMPSKEVSSEEIQIFQTTQKLKTTEQSRS